MNSLSGQSDPAPAPVGTGDSRPRGLHHVNAHSAREFDSCACVTRCVNCVTKKTLETTKKWNALRCTNAQPLDITDVSGITDIRIPWCTQSIGMPLFDGNEEPLGVLYRS